MKRTVHMYDFEDGNKTLCGLILHPRLRWTGYEDSYDGKKTRKVKVTCKRCLKAGGNVESD